MRIFLDTANLQDIKHWYSTGIIDGVTTNPTHLSKEGGDPKKLIKEICKVVPDGEISVEVTETDPGDVYVQAVDISQIAKNVIVKIPCHIDYYEVIKNLVEQSIPLNITLVFTPLQALMMCKLGVNYISPFIGRLNDAGENGLGVLEKIQATVLEHAFLDTSIIAASIRDVKTFEAAMLTGVDVATVPVAVLEQACKSSLTDAGMKKFLDDWKKLGIKQFP